MSNDIRSILERLAAVEEGRVTPVSVKKGLNQQQKSADQLPALFKPKNISPTLSKAPYQKHPMDGKLVGDSVEPKMNALEEAMQSVEEDMLSKVKKNFVDYLERLEDKNKIDRDLVKKAKEELNIQDQVEEDPTQDDPNSVPPQTPVTDPVLPEEDLEDTEVAHDVEQQAMSQAVAAEQPVKTVAMEDGAVLEIYGDQDRGFEIRHSGRSLPTRFPNIDHADMAVKLFQKRRKKANLDQDYLDEK